MARRRRFLCAAFLSLQTLATPVFAPTPGSDVAESEFCGFDWSLKEVETTKQYYRNEHQRIALGYLRVCEEVLQRYDLQKRLKSWPDLVPLLGFVPVDLSDTPFAQFELIGGVLNAQIPRFVNLRRTDHATRVFRRKDGLIVTLEEWDLSILGGGIAEVYRGPDVQVNGWPGYWSIEQAKSGKAYSSLWWQGATRKFELTVNSNLKLAGGQDAILQLAKSVPAGIPSGKLVPGKPELGIPGVLSKRPFPEQPPPF